MSKLYNYRFVAQIVLEATTPLKTASGKSDFFVDAPVLKDWNGLPMILGTSIAGVLRKSFEEEKANEIFGKDNGSRLLVSNAHLLDENQKLYHSLGLPNSEFLDKYNNLPIREHTAITHKGIAKKHSKFDEEVVFAGSRFKFELEFLGDKEEDEEIWQKILALLNSPLFRLGGGSTKGFGEMRVVSCLESSYIIGKDYQDKPSDLNISVGEEKKLSNNSSKQVCIYKINIKPDSFFSFGAGFGDDEVDDIFVTEEIVKWKDNKGEFSQKQILLPASSLKGALSHRVAFYYNKLKGNFIETITEAVEEYIGENNPAVATIFGASKSHKHEGKGKALFSDVFQEFKEDEVKIFDHVKIDRFTGGAIESALYNEKVVDQRDSWNIEIILAKEIDDDDIRKAFEKTLDDLCEGLLPLGGKVNRGHGIFEGSWIKEGCDVKK
ncbi:MAG: CRISPR-associated protein [Epsilonproteobacteria bacterium]|nr:CRISPR-associated protein [Campylobacterota bacterium]